jgi:serine/threonine protein kinase/Tfp pilus assembly protein PilF
MAITSGTKLGRYEIRSKIGEGGMGEVYLAEDTKLHRRVAIKFLPADSSTDEQANKRLLREAQAAAKLDHPNICAVHEVAEEDDRSFIVMAYVEGETLDVRMKRKPLELAESLAIATQVADALAEAHAHGIIHRDIKPSNIIITTRGQAKVMDFGLAKLVLQSAESEAETQSLLTTPGTIIGTMPYMSPEQVRGEKLDERSDIFSFGAVLYEMLTGRRPFAAKGGVATISAILSVDPPSLKDACPEASDEFERIVTKCLEKDRQRRYQSIREVASDLEAVRRNCDSGIAPSRSSERVTAVITPVLTDKNATRRALFGPRLGWTFAIVVIVLIAIAGGYELFKKKSGTLPPGSVRDVNSAAYDYYLRGKLNAGSENPQKNESAIKILEQVIKSDPGFAPAYAELARAYAVKANFFAPSAEKKTLYDEANVAVEKSLALDPNLAEGHFVRGDLLWTPANRFPHEQAIQSYKRAIELDPNLEGAHHQLGVAYYHIGLLDKGEEEIKKALAINPSDALARFRLGAININRGRYEEALAIFKTVPRDENTAIVHRATADALFHLGRTQEASELVEDYLKTYPKDEGGNVTSVKAMLLANAGKEAEAEEMIQRAIEIGKNFQHFHHTTYNIASAYALMNKPEQALYWLQFTADDGFPCYPLFENDANLNSLRKDERFIAFMAKQKQQWKRYNATL